MILRVIPGWQEQYENDLYKLIEIHGHEATDEIKRQILGGETAIWSEQVRSDIKRGLKHSEPFLAVFARKKSFWGKLKLLAEMKLLFGHF